MELMTMDAMLQYLVDKGGSDLHLIAGLPPSIRLHGEIIPVEGAERLTPDSAQEVVYSMLTEEQIQRFQTSPETRNELDFAYGIPGVGRFRCNVYRQRGTIGSVIRALAAKIPTLESLGLPASVSQFTELHRGLVLVTGPTGSGKSTTLAAMIDKINATRKCHIITVEDPIEYVHNSKLSFVSQREVGEYADTMSFRNALKYALRQDPDVILIGEMRDYETIGIAITSAETGHLVFGTLHTASASQTVGRMIDVFPSDQQNQVVTQLAANIQGVVSQILLPTSDGAGRVASTEIMRANTAIRNLIRTGSIDGIYQAIGTGSRDGMVTMDNSIMELVRTGKVTFEVAYSRLRDDTSRRQIEQFRQPGTPIPGSEPRAEVARETPTGAGASSDAKGESTGSKRPSMLSSAIPPWEQKKS
jgi:twitching motility protein PilT